MTDDQHPITWLDRLFAWYHGGWYHARNVPGDYMQCPWPDPVWCYRVLQHTLGNADVILPYTPIIIIAE